MGDVYYKDKAAYNQALLDAIKDARKQRVESPGVGFPNAVLALELLLFERERGTINAYKFDSGGYREDLVKATETAQAMQDEDLRAEVYLASVKPLSWPVYRQELKRMLDAGTGPDLTGNGEFDKGDVIILTFEALMQRILDVLKENGWLTWEANDEVAGGQGSGLDPDA
jgi:hypothetical protein